MIRKRSMGDVRAGKGRHVASRAVVLLFLTAGQRQAATVLLMTFQTAPTEKLRALVRGRHGVSIVARDAAQLAVAFLVAAALDYLLDMIDRLVLIGEPRPAYIDGRKQMQRQAGTKVKFLPAPAQHTYVAVEMALLADGAG